MALALAMQACSDRGAVVEPGAGDQPLFNAGSTSLPEVRFSEIHYDNVGTDTGEAIEIEGPAGTNLSGWTILLYNGNGGAVYNTRALSGIIPDLCEGRGVLVFTYPSNGIQNGGSPSAPEPDGFALVGSAGLVEFLSYEGTMVGVGGAANGVTSTDIGVFQPSDTPIGQSLQRFGGTWVGPQASSFGACNRPAEVASVQVTPSPAAIPVGATQGFTATARDTANRPIPGVTFGWSSSAAGIATVDPNGLATGVSVGTVTITATASNGVSGSASLEVTIAPPPGELPRFSEIHYDNTGTDVGEAIEVEGPAGFNLAGWTIVLYNGNGGVTYSPTGALSGVIQNQCDGRGTAFVNLAGIQNGDPDGFALVSPSNQVVEFLSYGGTFTATNGPANGMTSVDIGVKETSSTPVGHSLQRFDNAWYGPVANTFGSCNPPPPPPPASSITITGRLVSEPPLPVGYQDQLFATLRDGAGVIVPTTFTWSVETPETGSIDQNGVLTSLAAGGVTVRATAEDGTTRTLTLPTIVAVASTTAQYAGNAEFGEPTDADPSDDFLVRYDQYTASWNRNRGTPNWVSFNIDASHFGPEDRCDCFTFDPSLPAAFPRYTTADYTGAGTFHGYGIDRGHLARSFDRTSASLDNARTYLFTNIIPQAADQNQGPWAIMENDLGNLARNANKEVYVIAGVAGSKGTVKNEGKITIPAYTWKVAVILPRDHGLANVHGIDDLTIEAVVMPNDPGIRNVPWQTYRVTVDSVEALSGYDLLALLEDQIEIAVESNTRPPVAVLNGPFSSAEGSSVSMSGAGSSDPDGDALTFAWNFGDGGTATGMTVSHVYAQDGVYTVKLTVTDIRGLKTTTTSTATVTNVVPVIGSLAGATLLPGETYSAAGSFTDPGSDPWTATVNYGDGSGVQALALSGRTFALSHVYAVAGTFTVTVNVSDDDATATPRTATVTVWTQQQGLLNTRARVDQMRAAGRINGGNANALTSKLDNAIANLDAGSVGAALGQLNAFLNSLNDMEANGNVTPADAAALRALVQRVIASLS